VVDTLGDALRLFSELTPDQRDEFQWRNAIYMVNAAIKDPDTSPQPPSLCRRLRC